MALDGKTNSKDKLTSGPIGDKMRRIEKGDYNEKIVKFNPVDVSNVSNIKPECFNRDMKTLFKWSAAVGAGKITKTNAFFFFFYFQQELL